VEEVGGMRQILLGHALMALIVQEEWFGPLIWREMLVQQDIIVLLEQQFLYLAPLGHTPPPQVKMILVIVKLFLLVFTQYQARAF